MKASSGSSVPGQSGDEYRIKKSADVCATCTREFAVGDALVSTLSLAQDEPERKDVCIECFARADASRAASPEVAVDFAHWRTKKTEIGRARRKIDFAALRELFVRMLACPGPEYEKLCYLLGLVLLRKRALKLHEFVTDGGQDFLVVSVMPTTPESRRFRVIAPTLAQSDIAELRERLNSLLDVDVNPEEGLDVAASANPTTAGESGASSEASA